MYTSNYRGYTPFLNIDELGVEILIARKRETRVLICYFGCCGLGSVDVPGVGSGSKQVGSGSKRLDSIIPLLSPVCFIGIFFLGVRD